MVATGDDALTGRRVMLGSAGGDALLEAWQLVCDYVSQECGVDAEVLMREYVTQACNLAPFDIWIVSAGVIGQAHGCFADDFEIPDHGVECSRIGQGLGMESVG